MSAKKAKAGKFVEVSGDEAPIRVLKEDGKFYYCEGKKSYRKLNPNVREVEIEEPESIEAAWDELFPEVSSDAADE